jgi:CheY-like chemotaxis protein
MLKELGHSVTAEGDAERALRTLEREEFDLLFTDVGLPGLSGIELAAKALDLRPGLGVIYASGYGDPAAAGPGDPADAGPAGRNARATLLPKPYDLTDVEKALREAAGN